MNYKQQWIIVCSLLVSLLSCAKRIPISYPELKPPIEVRLTLTAQKTLTGVILKKDNDQLVFKNEIDGKTLVLKRNQIVKIEKIPTEVDEGGNLITQKEIKAHKNHKNLLLFSIGGTGLSFGGGLFISSLIYRSTNKDFEVINPISIGSAVVGAGLFAWQGEKRDKLSAVERVKEERKQQAQQQLEAERKKKEQLKQQLERLRKAKEEVEKEKARLQKELKKKKKQQNP